MPAAETTRCLDSRKAALKTELIALLGHDKVRDDPASLELYSEDIWAASVRNAALIATPDTLDHLSQIVAAAYRFQFAIAPRGAGMSYTNSHHPATDDSLIIDFTEMKRILDINPDDMTVTVQPGVTWKALYEALSARGLRTPFFGPMSGISSTIGGGLSQLNAMLGAGKYGTSSESVVALTMVLADGSILKTGARGQNDEHPFYRHYGPDLAGLFCGDSGTLGIKGEITLRLMKAPQHEDYCSFSFDSGEAMLRMLADVARAGIASETCGFDPGLTRVRLKRASLASDVKALGAVVAKEKSFAKGMFSAAKIAFGGRKFIEAEDYSLHLIADGRSAAAVSADIAEIRKLAEQHGGREIESTIARMIRAVPFPPGNSMLGPVGEAWVPVHGMIALSHAPALFAAMEDLFAEMASAFQREGIYTGYLFTHVSTNAITIEPVFYWPHGWRPIHEKHVEPQHLARLPKLPPNPDATAVVAEAKQRVVDLCAQFGCGHFQIGRTYRYRDSRDDASRQLLDAIKTIVDPNNRFNAGGLGFPIR